MPRKKIEVPFSEHLTIKGIKNVFIQQSEISGFSDINNWIDSIIAGTKILIDKKDAQYQAMLKANDAARDEEIKLIEKYKKFLDEKGLTAEFLARV